MGDFALLQRLCALRGVSGREDEVRTEILKEIPSGCFVSIDPLGSVIVEKKGRKRPARKLMICAHMDEVGLIVTSVTGDGLLRFATVGGIDEKVLAGIRVEIGDCAVPGVIAVKPIHLCEKDETGKPVAMDSLLIDIGAASKEEAEAAVRPGDAVTFAARFDAEGNVLRGKALDDRAGCALMIEMLRSEPEYDTTFVFNVQEEIGLRGSRVSSFTVAPDAAIVLESTTAGDLAGVPAEKYVCSLGSGAVVSFMDRATIYDREFYELAFQTAEECGAAVQPKLAVAGGNDAGAIHTSRGGVRTLAISLPCRYLHAPVGMIAKADYESALRLTVALAEKIAGGNG
ncbi:MAG: M42 family metallopeptidase [Acutalibacteraceae bacterium]|jgi:putative aminopeptidase FrvX